MNLIERGDLYIRKKKINNKEKEEWKNKKEKKGGNMPLESLQLVHNPPIPEFYI